MRSSPFLFLSVSVALLGGAPSVFAYTFSLTTSSGDPLHWADKNPSTPNTIDIWYDFRSWNGYSSSLTDADKTVIQQALADWSAITGGRIVFTQNTAASTNDIITIGIGNLAAVQQTSGSGGVLGVGGQSYIPNSPTSFRSGFLWLDSADTWDRTLGNGNTLSNTADEYNVAFHEIGHALGLSHSDNSYANMMNTYYYGEKLGPSQDDINGINAIYAAPGTDPATFYTVLTRTLSSFTLSATDQFNYATNTAPYPRYYYLDSGNTTITGETRLDAGNYTSPTNFMQSGGLWTTNTLTINGAATYSTGTYALSGGTLTATGSAAINQKGTFLQTGGILTAPALSVAGNGTFTQSAGTASLTSVNIASGGTFSFVGGALSLQNVSSAGTASFSAAPTWRANATLTVTGGTTSLANDAGSAANTPLSVQANGGTLSFSSPQHLASLSIGSSGRLNVAAGGDNLLLLQSLSFASGGRLDLANNDLILHNAASADYATLQARLNTARANGAWNGAGLQSSTAAGHNELGFGLLTGADWLLLHPATTFDAMTVLATDLLVKYTYAGDADLSGRITLDDYAQLDAGFLLQPAAPAWLNGDFNYDGLVDYRDYALIDNAFAQQSGSLAADLIRQHAASFGLPYQELLTSLQLAVPEPASLVLLAAGAASLLTRRLPRPR